MASAYSFRERAAQARAERQYAMAIRHLQRGWMQLPVEVVRHIISKLQTALQILIPEWGYDEDLRLTYAYYTGTLWYRRFMKRVQLYTDTNRIHLIGESRATGAQNEVVEPSRFGAQLRTRER